MYAELYLQGATPPSAPSVFGLTTIQVYLFQFTQTN
jgi:hypothetical protein